MSQLHGETHCTCMSAKLLIPPSYAKHKQLCITALELREWSWSHVKLAILIISIKKLRSYIQLFWTIRRLNARKILGYAIWHTLHSFLHFCIITQFCKNRVFANDYVELRMTGVTANKPSWCVLMRVLVNFELGLNREQHYLEKNFLVKVWHSFLKRKTIFL